MLNALLHFFEHIMLHHAGTPDEGCEECHLSAIDINWMRIVEGKSHSGLV